VRRGALDCTEELARSTRALLDRSFLDPKDGEYRYLVSREGALVDPIKFLYAQAFAVYGLCAYGQAFKEPEAIEAALRCFRSFDARAHDSRYGGYDETGDPEFVTEGAVKDTNTHLHLMESLSELYRASGDPLVKSRLTELVEVLTTRLQMKEGHVHPFFDVDFTPRGEPRTSYGHDIETAWLLVDAAQALGHSPSAVKDASVRMASCAVRDGFDTQRGGFYDVGVPGGRTTSFAKIWWAQFEGLLGLWWLHRFTGAEDARQKLVQTLDWIEGPQRDAEHGEWYFGVMPDGTLQDPELKGTIWKATYHTVRALLFLQDELRLAEESVPARDSRRAGGPPANGVGATTDV
jgi:mannobiose 2-epimerase